MRHEQYRNFLRRLATTHENILAWPNYHLHINMEAAGEKKSPLVVGFGISASYLNMCINNNVH